MPADIERIERHPSLRHPQEFVFVSISTQWLPMLAAGLLVFALAPRGAVDEGFANVAVAGTCNFPDATLLLRDAPCTSNPFGQINDQSCFTLLALAGAGASFAACGGVPATPSPPSTARPSTRGVHATGLRWPRSPQGTPAPSCPIPKPTISRSASPRSESPRRPRPRGSRRTTDAQHKTHCREPVRAAAQPGDAAADQLQVDPGQGRSERTSRSPTPRSRSPSTSRRSRAARRTPTTRSSSRSPARREEDIIAARASSTCSSNKIRDEVVKGKDKVSDKAITDSYNKNKARFAQPEQRDLRVVLTKEEGRGGGPGRSRGRRVVEEDHEEVLDRRHDQGGPAASSPRRPRARSTRSSTRPFRRHEGRAGRPDQDPVRLLRLQGPGHHRGFAAVAGRGQGDDQADARLPGAAEGARHLREGLHEALEGKDRVLRGLQDLRLQERPEGHADPLGGRHAGVPGRARRLSLLPCSELRRGSLLLAVVSAGAAFSGFGGDPGARGRHRRRRARSHQQGFDHWMACGEVRRATPSRIADPS